MGNRSVPPRPSEAKPFIGKGHPSPRRARKLTAEERDEAEKYLGDKGLVARLARKFSRKCPGIASEDFFQAGFEGLADAIKGFDDDMKIRFDTYAYLRIVGACKDMMRGEGIIQFPHSAIKRGEARPVVWSSDLASDPANSDSDLGRGQEAWAAMNMPPADVPAPGAAIESDDAFEAWMKGLTKAEKYILRAYYGVTPRTMRQIGHDLEMSESRVSQMHEAILDRLREKAAFPKYRELAIA